MSTNWAPGIWTGVRTAHTYVSPAGDRVTVRRLEGSDVHISYIGHASDCTACVWGDGGEQV